MHYVIGDIHGQIHELKLLLEKLHLTTEDKVYFVGDWFDRAYTESDMAETVKWMLENLREGSQFRTVVGNHDLQQLDRIYFYMQRCNNSEEDIDWQLANYLPESEGHAYIRSCYPQLKELIENMPLYETFMANGQEYLVTHSWLWDNSERALGTESFDINDLNVSMSIWDRNLSVSKYEYSEDIPIVVHGHTPTLGKYDIWTEGCRSLARIQKVSEKNINVDCCAFYSPLRGGNLAAYCCEDGSEIYAYEEEDFFELVDKYYEKMPFENTDITKEQWYLAVLFRDQYSIFNPKIESSPCFENEKVKRVYEKIREQFKDCSETDFGFEIHDYVRRLKDRLHRIVPKYWLMCRGE